MLVMEMPDSIYIRNRFVHFPTANINHNKMILSGGPLYLYYFEEVTQHELKVSQLQSILLLQHILIANNLRYNKCVTFRLILFRTFRFIEILQTETYMLISKEAN